MIHGGRQWTKANAYQPRQYAQQIREKRQAGWWRYSGLWLGAILVGLAVGLGPGWLGNSQSSTGKIQAFVDSQGVRARFSFCHTGGGYNCVVDGDTIWLRGQNIRIAGIDAPETHEYRCPEEKALGDRATARLLQLVNSGTVTTSRIDRDEDRYGRKLRHVMVDGVSVEKVLVEQGLARWYGGGKRSWC